MTTPNPKPPAAPHRKLVLRRIAERPALPVVRPPPRPSDESLDAVRLQAGSLPPVAATWPPPLGPVRDQAGGRRVWSNRPMWIACGVAAVGAIVAGAAGLTVPPGPHAKATAAIQGGVLATSPLSPSPASGHADRPARASTPWVEVPVHGAAGATSAIPASALPLARPNAAPRALPRTATTTAPVPTASSALPASADSASLSVLAAPGARATLSMPGDPAPKTAQAPKATGEETHEQPALAPSP
jgi:hypothetical protein